MLLQIFYRAFDQLNNMIADNVTGGSIVNESYVVSLVLLDQMTKKI